MKLASPLLRRVVTAVALLAMTGCGVSERIGKRLEDSWASDLLADSEQLVLTSDGGNQLNPDRSGTPLSVVMRVYQLSDLERFAAADANTLWLDANKALGNTVMESREITLLPGLGQVDRWPLLGSTRYVGVAAFFHDEHSARWKVAFDAESLRKDGIWFSSRGLHVLVDQTEVTALRGLNVLDKPPTATAPRSRAHFNFLADDLK